MLKVDLGLLRQTKRLLIDGEIPAGDPLWTGAELVPGGSLRVRLEVQAAGADVVARGWLEGTLSDRCRRCLVPVVVPLRAEVMLFFRAGVDEAEAEQEEVYALATGAQELDLRDAIRQELMLAAPAFVVCRDGCKGLCPHCGANWNETTCSCTDEQPDARWAALRSLRHD